MATRYLYIARHGHADAFGRLTDVGAAQARLLGQRLAHLPINSVWHSPLSRAADSARQLNIFFTGDVPVRAAPELIDNVPYVPSSQEIPPAWAPFFDGYQTDEAAAGYRVAQDLTDRFATTPGHAEDLHEVLITHDYPIAWLIRDALGAPFARWLGISSANCALTLIEYRTGLLPSVVLFNDMSHLPPEFQWTGFPETVRP